MRERKVCDEGVVQGRLTEVREEGRPLTGRLGRGDSCRRAVKYASTTGIDEQVVEGKEVHHQYRLVHLLRSCIRERNAEGRHPSY